MTVAGSAVGSGVGWNVAVGLLSVAVGTSVMVGVALPQAVNVSTSATNKLSRAIRLIKFGKCIIEKACSSET
jgi:hypothetical protein